MTGRGWIARCAMAASLAACQTAPASGPVPSVQPMGAADEYRLDAAARETAVERLARSLETLYVKPALGDSLARHVRGRLAARSYDELSSPRAFANALSHDLDSIAHDLHLWVRYFPPMTNGGQGPDLDETWLNHGYPSARIMDGNVGYLDVRNFNPGPAAIRAMTAAMTLVSDCDALIVDIRNNGGGTTPMMVRLASYLFADSVHLADLYWRDLPDTIRGWTQPGSVAVHLSRQPVYVVTSRRTFSAAEHFAYSLQETRRATIVGERTRGGAHSARGGLQDLGSGLRALVPSGAAVGTRTKANWERVGVAPDVVVADSLAVRVAHRAAVEALIASAEPGPRRDRLERALRILVKDDMLLK